MENKDENKNQDSGKDKSKIEPSEIEKYIDLPKEELGKYIKAGAFKIKPDKEKPNENKLPE